MAISDKLNFLIETKSQLKDMINYGLPTENQITNETTFRNYVKGIFEAFLESLRDSTTLYTNLPKISGNGTQITLNDTANAPMRITLKASELTQDGTPTPDSPQDIHTISGSNKVVVCGKNLFNKDNISTNFSWNFNASAVLNSDKSVTVTANSNNQAHYMVILPVYHYEVGKTYTISVKNNNSAGVGYLRMFYSSWQTQYGNGSKTSITFTVQEGDKTDLGIGIYLNTNAVVTFYDFQIEEGSTATEYEPYVSQTAPLNLPVENLFDENNEHKVVINPATGIERYGLRFKAPNKKVSISGTWRNNLSLTYRLITNNVASDYVSILANTTISVIDEIVIYCGDDNVKMSSIVSNLQIEISDKPNSYTPYGTTPIEYCKIGNYEDEFIYNKGKNEIPFQDGEVTLNGITISVSGGIVKLNGTATATSVFKLTNGVTPISGFYIDNNWLNENVITNKNNNTFSINYVSGSGDTGGCAFRIYADTTTYLNQYYPTKTSQSTSYTESGKISCIVFFFNSGASFDNYTFTLQLEKGTSVTDFEPTNDKWYLKKNIGKVVLDGSESGWYSIQTATTPTNRTVTKMNNLIKFPVTNYFSNYFIKGSQTSNRIALVTPDTIYLSLDDTLTTITSGDTDEQKLTKMKAWLNSNNTTLYYVLETPAYTQITGTLETQLNNIYEKLLSYKGTTNVSQINNDLPFVLGVSAIQDLE